MIKKQDIKEIIDKMNNNDEFYVHLIDNNNRIEIKFVSNLISGAFASIPIFKETNCDYIDFIYKTIKENINFYTTSKQEVVMPLIKELNYIINYLEYEYKDCQNEIDKAMIYTKKYFKYLKSIINDEAIYNEIDYTKQIKEVLGEDFFYKNIKGGYINIDKYERRFREIYETNKVYNFNNDVIKYMKWYNYSPKDMLSNYELLINVFDCDMFNAQDDLRFSPYYKDNNYNYSDFVMREDLRKRYIKNYKKIRDFLKTFLGEDEKNFLIKELDNKINKQYKSQYLKLNLDNFSLDFKGKSIADISNILMLKEDYPGGISIVTKDVEIDIDFIENTISIVNRKENIMKFYNPNFEKSETCKIYED